MLRKKLLLIGFGFILLLIVGCSLFKQEICVLKDPNFKDELGITPLIYASSRGHIYIVELLLDLGANPNIVDFNEKNAKYTDITKCMVCFSVISNVCHFFYFNTCRNKSAAF